MNIVRNSDGTLNREYWNVVKGIGIICIVIGHCVMPIQNLVYLFHVPLFFFLSGYFYNEKKYGDTPWDNLQARMQLWIKYVVMYAIYVVGHNVLMHFDMLRQGETFYSWQDMFTKLAYVVVGCGDELLAGPLWFVPTLVMSSFLLGWIVWISRCIERKTGAKFLKFLFQGIVITGLSAIGYGMAYYEINPPAHMRVALMVMPYFEIGYLLRNYMADFEKKLNGWIALGLFGFLCVYSKNHLYNLVDEYVSPFMNITAIAGIYVCLTISKQICKIRKCNGVRNVLVVLGNASFMIMGMHFLIIRSIDRIYTAFAGDISWMYAAYLGNHNVLIPGYLLLGIGIPTVIYQIIGQVWKNGIRSN